MTNNSKYFDSIRIKRRKRADAPSSDRLCEWEGCNKPGTHKAPLGRGMEGKYKHFCIDHVREYNKSYNYFKGLPDDAISSYQKDAATGHRPTWAMGANSWGNNQPGADTKKTAFDGRVKDPHGVFEKGFFRPHQPAAEAQKRKVKRLEKKAFETLHLAETATAEEIKARYKDFVKKLHPDANGGDRSREDQLRQIIQAYNSLKQGGYC